MVFIKIEGADQTIAMEFSASVQKALAEKLGIAEKELVFVCPETFLVHSGQEQTSFQVLVEVLLPTTYKSKEKEVAQLLRKHLQNIAIHSHIVFVYFDKDSEYDEINHDYPDYMDNTNTVIPESAEEEDAGATNQPDPYMGNVFEELDSFIAKHPEMNADEATFEYYKQKNQK